MDDVVFNDLDDDIYSLTDSEHIHWKIDTTLYSMNSFYVSTFVEPSKIGIIINYSLNEEQFYKAEIIFKEYDFYIANEMDRITFFLNRKEICTISNPPWTIKDVMNVGPNNRILHNSQIKFMSFFEKILKLKAFT